MNTDEYFPTNTKTANADTLRSGFNDAHMGHIGTKMKKCFERHEQDSNLRGKIPIDF